MNKISLILFFVVAIACQQEQPNTIDESTNLMIDELKKENLKLNRTLNGRDSLVNNYAKSINDIRLNLSKIRNQQNLIVRKKNNAENLSIDNTDLVQEIQLIGELMLDNKQIIQILNEQLSNSNGELNELEKLLTTLSEEVEIKNMEIFYLQEELENMDASFSALFDQYTENIEELESTRDLLNTAWYCFGTKNELLNNGVITKEGGFIGLGKNTVLKNDFNKSYFNEIKIDELSELSLGVKTVELITSHPSNSYELIVSNKVDKFIILDADLFWSNSKYLVLEVK